MVEKGAPGFGPTLPLPTESRDPAPAEAAIRRSAVSLLVYHRDGADLIPLGPGAGVTVGRDPACDVSLPDRSLSWQHARFELRGNGLWVEDLGSTNGTKVNGARISVCAVRPGDEVGLGAVLVVSHALEPQGQRPRALASHDQFLRALGDEVSRARTFGRSLGVAVVRALGPDPAHVSRWSGELRRQMRPFDRIALYSQDTVEVLLPESTSEQARAWAGQLARQGAGASALAFGLAAYPDAGTSPDALLEAALAACRRAGPAGRISEAASQGTKAVSPSGLPTETETAPGAVVASDAMREVYALARRLGGSTLPVLLHGETGSGKELVARAIHEEGPRRDRPMVCVNCGALPAQLVESTLFGHERGAFTGATQQSKGVFETANGGTVFLDEIGELPPPAQVALLRVLDTQRFSRVGSSKEIEVDVRVVAATHRSLEEMCEVGSFRSDLLYRLNAMTVTIPPLRDRPEEIGPLVEHFLRRANEANGTAVESVAPDAMERLRAYPWPGNVRELGNAIERAVVIARGNVITCDDLPERLREVRGSASTSSRASDEEAGDIRVRLQEYEARLILDALKVADWDRNEAARRLALPLRTLARRMKALGIKRAGYEVEEESD